MTRKAEVRGKGETPLDYPHGGLSSASSVRMASASNTTGNNHNHSSIDSSINTKALFQKCNLRIVLPFLLICIGVSEILMNTQSLIPCRSSAPSNGTGQAAAATDTIVASASPSLSPPFLLELETICGQQETSQHGKDTDDTNNSPRNLLPPRELLSLEEIHQVVQYFYTFNCPLKESCKFGSLGQHLLHAAIQQNKTLLTVQIGAMDGYSNDPMHGMFVKQSVLNPGARNNTLGPPKPMFRNHVHRNTDAFNLQHWLPVLFEPVPRNFETLKHTYNLLQNKKQDGLGCAVPIHAAVSYDGMTADDLYDKHNNKNETASSSSSGSSPSSALAVADGGGPGECRFCRFNTDVDAPDACKKQPDWMKYQLGSMDCEAHKKFHKQDFDLCILQTPLPCGTLLQLLATIRLQTAPIAILQIDIEGMEYLLLEGLLEETPEQLLPPVIHYEHKVMKARDTNTNTGGTNYKIANFSRYNHTKSMLQSKGYALHDQGEDYLAVRVSR